LTRANILRAKLENKPIFALDLLCKSEENPPDGLHISYHKIKNIWSLGLNDPTLERRKRGQSHISRSK